LACYALIAAFDSLCGNFEAMDTAYKLPAMTRIGHVHLKVTDLQRAIDFYCDY
jgi:catechol-2,3-dioxygenase